MNWLIDAAADLESMLPALLAGAVLLSASQQVPADRKTVAQAEDDGIHYNVMPRWAKN
jgi:hypothetical protein